MANPVESSSLQDRFIQSTQHQELHWVRRAAYDLETAARHNRKDAWASVGAVGVLVMAASGFFGMGAHVQEIGNAKRREAAQDSSLKQNIRSECDQKAVNLQRQGQLVTSSRLADYQADCRKAKTEEALHKAGDQYVALGGALQAGTVAFTALGCFALLGSGMRRWRCANQQDAAAKEKRIEVERVRASRGVGGANHHQL